MLCEVRNAISVPVMRKDFIISGVRPSQGSDLNGTVEVVSASLQTVKQRIRGIGSTIELSRGFIGSSVIHDVVDNTVNAQSCIH